MGDVLTADREHRSTLVRRTLPAGVLDAAAVVVGAVLIVVAALNQPYNENEFLQMGPYDEGTVEGITSGTRQPPLDPLLGALMQRLFGIGQLQQRLVPVLAGIGILVVTALLFRRLRLGLAGSVGLWMMATSPVLLRYSAYTRPYALPLFCMVLFCYAAHRWLEDRHRGWLVAMVVAAGAMPAARVPEPNVFLLSAAATVAFLAWRGRWAWSRAWPVVATAVAGVVFVGYPMYRNLASEASSIYDPSPSGVWERLPTGVRELVTAWLPLAGDWFPWWPVTALVIVAALALPASRRRLFGWWWFWPLLAAPVAFVAAYHFVNDYSLDVRPYRPRFLMFFVPAHALVVTALATVPLLYRTGATALRRGIAGLLAVAFVAQLPTTWWVLTENEAADFEAAAERVAALPNGAIVLFDSAAPVGRWRQSFQGEERYLGDDAPYIGYVAKLAKRARSVPESGPVRLLVLDSRCAGSVICDEEPADWDGELPGWRVVEEFDRFTLHEPEADLDGREGTIRALTELGEDMGPEYGHPAILAAAKLLRIEGRTAEGRALLREMYDAAGPPLAREIAAWADDKGMQPFPRRPVRPVPR